MAILPANNFLRAINEMRKRKEFCDVKLLSDEKDEFMAHRVVLSSCCRVVHQMLLSKEPNRKLPILELKNVPSNILSVVVEFAYSGEVDITMETVQELLMVAQLLDVPSLTKLCITFVQERLTVQTCFSIAKIANNVASKELLDIVNNFSQDNFPPVCADEQFLKLSVEEFLEYICNKELIEEHRQEFNSAIQVWLEHNPGEHQLLEEKLKATLQEMGMGDLINSLELKRMPMMSDDTPNNGGGTEMVLSNQEMKIIFINTEEESNELMVMLFFSVPPIFLNNTFNKKMR
uniref:Ring canal kelch protein-like n=1 Tax=Saccoglossus kowalevskii TaxID=10224 RepID=A0ABM0MIY7_SACKO|nr:PREDICTED: ring canal kelch protein-like [Saccoglossus kowalevskii]